MNFLDKGRLSVSFNLLEFSMSGGEKNEVHPNK